MTKTSYIVNEADAAVAFDRQAPVFDRQFGNDTIIKYKRDRVRAHVLQNLPLQATILELNAGTGEDAIFFAQKGHCVHATDISTGMLDELLQKAKRSNLGDLISHEKCSFTSLHQLTHREPYDLVFSNFGGLNCTARLDEVLHSLTPLVKPGGIVTLVVLPKFCLWEFLLLFRGKLKTALRRFSGSKGATAHIEGRYFRCWYYNPSYIVKHLGADFKLLKQEALCVFTPPSYISGFAEKHPRLFSVLKKLESKLQSRWPWKHSGDYYIISLRKQNG